MKVLLWLSVLVALGCGQLHKAKPLTVEPGLRGTYEVFLADAATNGASKRLRTNVIESIAFVPSLSQYGVDIAGYCQTEHGTDWDGSKWEARRVLIAQDLDLYPWQWRDRIYHELGHCLLDLNHTAEGSGEIMERSISTDEPSGAEWLQRIAYLFTGDGN